jgi:exodeoxyribonuclease-5
MNVTPDIVVYSADQSAALAQVQEILLNAGVDLNSKTSSQINENSKSLIAVIGRAGSGKTMLLTDLVARVKESGVRLILPDYFKVDKENRRTLSILAPTNKAASVLRNRGVPATTIHRVLYTPLYDPEYEKIADWLVDGGKKPVVKGFDEKALDRANSFYSQNKSIPGAFASIGLKGSDFIKGWKRRDESLDIGFVDESSMLDDQQLKDLSEIFNTLVLFGDPAQLPPVGQSGEMTFDKLPENKKIFLSRIHRQSQDNPILDLAHALADPCIDFSAFENLVEDFSRVDDRIVCAGSVKADLMSRSPVLVWRNNTRVRLIQAYRLAYGSKEDMLLVGEPLICDGIELPLKHRKKRIDLEARGLIKGAQVIYLGSGKKNGFSRLHVIGAEDPNVSVASIIKIETLDQDEPFIPFAARMGATFLHGAAITIHKAQGSQWESVQVFSPDIYASAMSGRSEAGQPLWKRLAYVAITRAQKRLYWVKKNRLEKPTCVLAVADLAV